MNFPIERFLYLPKGDHYHARIKVNVLTAVRLESNIQDIINKGKSPYIKTTFHEFGNYVVFRITRAIWDDSAGVLIEGNLLLNESLLRGKIIAPRFFIDSTTLNEEFMQVGRWDDSEDFCMGEFVAPSQSIFQKFEQLVPEVLFSAKLPPDSTNKNT